MTIQIGFVGKKSRFLAEFLGMGRHPLQAVTMRGKLSSLASVRLWEWDCFAKWIFSMDLSEEKMTQPTSNIQNPTSNPHSVWRADLALAFNTLIWGSTFVLVKRALD